MSLGSVDVPHRQTFAITADCGVFAREIVPHPEGSVKQIALLSSNYFRLQMVQEMKFPEKGTAENNSFRKD